MHYLRPCSLFGAFAIERKKDGPAAHGRFASGYEDRGESLNGSLAEAKPEEIERFRQIGHPVSHTIVQRGRRVAAEGDRLRRNGCFYYVQGVDDPGGLGLWTIYYAEERRDADGHKPETGGR